MMDEESLTLEQMDIALLDEIKVQRKKSSSHIAVDGSLITKQTGQYLYIFILQDSWEPQDDTPFKSNFGGSQEIKGTIGPSTGTTITNATEEPLPPETLSRISLVDDPTQLLEQLREALNSNKEEILLFYRRVLSTLSARMWYQLLLPSIRHSTIYLYSFFTFTFNHFTDLTLLSLMRTMNQQPLAEK